MEKIKEKLIEEFEKFDIIDAHEHLTPEEERIKMKLDVFSFFSHYTKGDLLRAGMKEETYNLLFNRKIPLEKRWRKFAPYWEKIRFTSYSRSVIYTLKKFYGYEDLNEKNYRELSEKIQERNKKGIYREVLRKTCKIKHALTQCAKTDVDKNKKDPILIPVMPLLFINPEITIKDFEGIEGWKKYVNYPIKSLDDLIDKIEIYLKKIKKEGAVGVKTKSYPHLYPFNKPDRKKAEGLFNNIKRGKIKKTHCINPLYYYILDKSIEMAIKQDFVIAVHTGYWGDFRNLSPLHLIPFLEKYPEGKFDIYHFGYPWIRETIMLGKGFSNVWLNFCWLHIISQKAAKEAIDEVIETVPRNKIIGFGGDYITEAVEKVYGHLKMAKEDMVDVLSKKVKEGYLKIDDAKSLIREWFYQNPYSLYLKK